LFEATAKAKHSKGIEVGVCPPFVYLEKIGARLKAKKYGVMLGAQDAFWENEGPHTGEIGPSMLKQFGVRYVIVGHSERRAFGETDGMVRKKVQAALNEGLKVILCVGESALLRRGGLGMAQKFVKGQLVQDLKDVKRSQFARGLLIVAYEPIWAIGTGRNCPAADAVQMAQLIRSVTSRSVPVLYGGSTNDRNVADYVQYKEIDGALVGGASLRADGFGAMIKVVSELKK
jgi:triosephosphate isomerase